jgi:hypothetical protein
MALVVKIIEWSPQLDMQRRSTFESGGKVYLTNATIKAHILTF